MSSVKKIPEGYHSITPGLIVKDGLKAIEYYKKVFGAVGKGTMMMPDNKSVAHAELEIGDSKIIISNIVTQIGSWLGGNRVNFHMGSNNKKKQNKINLWTKV